MGFKKYIIASFVFLMIVAAYVYSIDNSEFTVKIVELGINKTLPIYIWIITPALFLFFATIIHMLFYGTKSYLQRSTIKKDISKLSMIINDRLLDKTSSLSLKTPSLKEIADVLNTVEFKLTKQSETSPLIESTLKIITDIENGKYIPHKGLKLPVNNIWAIKNTKNRLLNDENFAIEVIKDVEYPTDLIEMAFDIALENKPVETVKRITESTNLTKNMIKKLLLKDSEQLSLTNGEIFNYITNHAFTNKELIAIAKNYKKTMAPEQLIHLFDDLSSKNEDFTTSYLFVLFEYQMIDKAREILVNSQKNEYVLFKALLDLKDSGKYNYSVDDFILE
jgi:signal recognition particle subunit SEC65